MFCSIEKKKCREKKIKVGINDSTDKKCVYFDFIYWNNSVDNKLNVTPTFIKVKKTIDFILSLPCGIFKSLSYPVLLKYKVILSMVNECLSDILDF